MPAFIGVHVGAGHLSHAKERRYRAACARACKEAMTLLKSGASAVDAIATAIQVLEDDETTNAGYGSNLTLHGTVECDASLMDGRTGSFGAVGAVSGLKNPIRAAERMVLDNNKGLMSLGRVPPMFLTGQGAKAWAAQQGLEIVPDASLIERKAFATWESHLLQMTNPGEAPAKDLGHDTVGAVCIDLKGNVASGVSSGGISLKYPGRVGEAAMFGCGTWAQNASTVSPGVACSTSGTGEQIMRTLFTKQCVDRLLSTDDLQAALKDSLQSFSSSPALHMFPEKSVGIIALRQSTRLEFWFGHITESMGIGYMSDTANGPTTLVSRKSSPQDAMAVSGQLV